VLPSNQIKVVKEEVLVVVNPQTGSLHYYRIVDPELEFVTELPSLAKIVHAKIENLKSSIDFIPAMIFKEPAAKFEQPKKVEPVSADPLQATIDYLQQWKYGIVSAVGIVFLLIAACIFFSKKRALYRKE
jgi:predicted PurR-regulated permease PerM